MANQEGGKLVRLSCTVMWAYLNKPNEEFGGKYEFVCASLTPKAVEALESIGLEPKLDDKKPEWGHYIKCKSNRPITAVDEDNNKLRDVTVGNGSKAIVTIGTYAWTFKNKKGVSASCKKLVITDLKEYTGPNIDESAVADTL